VNPIVDEVLARGFRGRRGRGRRGKEVASLPSGKGNFSVSLIHGEGPGEAHLRKEERRRKRRKCISFSSISMEGKE